mmetsp:Transcript_14504/g.54798  ORF Transcript_14504/g.54798 Transcript_14504/m.54798 type:complete len:333 (-) Transcript_14504:1488-2486(-)
MASARRFSCLRPGFRFPLRFSVLPQPSPLAPGSPRQQPPWLLAKLSPLALRALQCWAVPSALPPQWHHCRQSRRHCHCHLSSLQLQLQLPLPLQFLLLQSFPRQLPLRRASSLLLHFRLLPCPRTQPDLAVREALRQGRLEQRRLRPQTLARPRPPASWAHLQTAASPSHSALRVDSAGGAAWPRSIGFDDRPIRAAPGHPRRPSTLPGSSSSGQPARRRGPSPSGRSCGPGPLRCRRSTFGACSQLGLAMPPTKDSSHRRRLHRLRPVPPPSGALVVPAPSASGRSRAMCSCGRSQVATPWLPADQLGRHCQRRRLPRASRKMPGGPGSGF